MSDEEKKLLNKARLWLILHGENTQTIYDKITGPYPAICDMTRCIRFSNDKCSGKRLWTDKTMKRCKYTTQNNVIDEEEDKWFCLEWVKYV